MATTNPSLGTTDQSWVSTVIHGAPKAFPKTLQPDLWREQFQHGSTKEKKVIARAWFDGFNNCWNEERKTGNNDVAILHALVTQYYAWIAELAPWVEKVWFSPSDFNGSLARLIKLTASRCPDKLPAEYIKIVHQLWFEKPSNPHHLVSKIYDMHLDGQVKNTGAGPADSAFWGMLVPSFAWDAIEALPVDAPNRAQYEAQAVWMTTTASLDMHQPLHHHKSPIAMAWQALMWHTFNEEPMDVYDYQGYNLHELVLARPTIATIGGLAGLVEVCLAPQRNLTNSGHTAPVKQPVAGPLNIYSALQAWTRGMDKHLDIGEAAQLSTWQLVRFYLDDMKKAETQKDDSSTDSGSITLPDNLTGF